MAGEQFRKAILVVLRDGINSGILQMNTVLSRERGLWAGDLLQISYVAKGPERPIVQVICGAPETIAHDHGKPANAIEVDGFIEQGVQIRQEIFPG